MNLLENLKNKFTFNKKVNNTNFIVQTFLDLKILFKNFIHWNISKLIIVLYSIIIGFISVIPFIIIFFIYTFFSDVDMTMLISGMFSGQLLFDLIGNILLLLIIIIYFIIFSYSNILLLRLNNEYKNGYKLNYKNSIYFDYKRLYKYFKLTCLNILILIIPILVLGILIGILFLFSGGVIDTLNLVKTGVFNYFTVFSIIFTVLAGLTIAYIYYRIVFSYLLLADDKYYNNDLKVFDYIKESFNRTKGIKKLFKFFILIIIFVFLSIPINYVDKILQNNGKFLTDYSTYLNSTEDQKNNIQGNDTYYYEALKVEFNGLTKNDISRKNKLNFIYSILFSIFNFIFIYGLFMMIFTSFYRKELCNN